MHFLGEKNYYWIQLPNDLLTFNLPYRGYILFHRQDTKHSTSEFTPVFYISTLIFYL